MPNSTSTSEQAILSGGAQLTVTHVDGSSETVTVRLLKIREFPEYLRLTDQEEGLAAFLCDKDDSWAESLCVDSLLDVCDKGHELNFSNACRWGQRRANINEALLPIAASGQKVQSVYQSFAPSAPASSAEV